MAPNALVLELSNDRPNTSANGDVTLEQAANLLHWLAIMSFDVIAVLVVVPVVVIAALGTLFVRAVFGTAIVSTSHVGPSKLGAAAEIYAVIIGFIIVVAYAEFQDAKGVVFEEASLVSRLISYSETLSSADGERLSQAAAQYANDVAEIEWPLPAFGRSSPEVDMALDNIDRAILQVGAATATSQLVIFRLTGIADEISKRRMQRLSLTPDYKVAELLFRILAVGTFLVVVTGWFLRGPSVLVHLFLAMLISASVTTLLATSAQLLYPFDGAIRIPPDQFLAIALGGTP